MQTHRVVVLCTGCRASNCSQLLKLEVMSPVVTSSSLLGRARQYLHGIFPVFLSASIKKFLFFLVISRILYNFPFLTCICVFQTFLCGRGLLHALSLTSLYILF